MLRSTTGADGSSDLSGSPQEKRRSKRGSVRRRRAEEKAKQKEEISGPFPGIQLHGDRVGPAIMDMDRGDSSSSPSLSPMGGSPRRNMHGFLLKSSGDSPAAESLSELTIEQLRKRVLSLEQDVDALQKEAVRWKGLYFETLAQFRDYDASKGEMEEEWRNRYLELFFSQPGVTSDQLPDFMRIINVEDAPTHRFSALERGATDNSHAYLPHSELQKSLSQPFFPKLDEDTRPMGRSTTTDFSRPYRTTPPQNRLVMQVKKTEGGGASAPHLSQLSGSPVSRSQSEGSLSRMLNPVRRKGKSRKVNKTGSMLRVDHEKYFSIVEQMKLAIAETGTFDSVRVKETTKKVCNEYRKFIEGQMVDLFGYLKERSNRRYAMEDYIRASSMSPENKEEARADFRKKETLMLRKRRVKLSLHDFQILTLIGKGAYGKVFLVKKKDSGDVFALKQISKSLLIEKDQLDSILVEREVLGRTKSPWIVHLHFTFHDEHSLFLAMDYVPGGDLRTVLDEVDLELDQAKFYSCEMFLAVATLHKWGFVHRDLKPANFLISREGHLKLTDFGLSKGDLVKEDTKSPVKIYLQDNRYKTLLLGSSVTVAEVYKMLEEKLMQSSEGFRLVEEIEGGKRRPLDDDRAMVDVMIGWKVGAHNRFLFLPADSLKEDPKLFGSSTLGRVFIKKKGSPKLKRHSGSTLKTTSGDAPSAASTALRAPGRIERHPSSNHMPSQDLIKQMEHTKYRKKKMNFKEMRLARKGDPTSPERVTDMSNRERYLSVVGSPDYMAIEVLQSKGYERSVDFWAIGAMTYEMFFGFPPFAGDTPQEVFINIVNYKEALSFPEEDDEDATQIPEQAKDLIRSLLTEPEHRLGRVGGIEEIKNHPFYEGVDWDTQLQQMPPFVPDLESKEDHTYFSVPDSPHHTDMLTEDSDDTVSEL